MLEVYKIFFIANRYFIHNHLFSRLKYFDFNWIQNSIHEFISLPKNQAVGFQSHNRSIFSCGNTPDRFIKFVTVQVFSAGSTVHIDHLIPIFPIKLNQRV